MRFVEKIEHARLDGIRLDVHQWWDPGDPNDPETGPCACLIGMAAWTDRLTSFLPGRLFAAYPWLNEFVEFKGRELNCYVAIASVSRLINDRVITWREAYSLDVRNFHETSIRDPGVRLPCSRSKGRMVSIAFG